MAPRPGTGKGLAGVFNKVYEAYANDSELDEILSLSDRVAVFFEGEIVGTFTAAEANEASIGLCMGGRRRSA